MCIISIIITNKCLLCAVKWLEPVKALSISMHWFTWPSRARGHMPSNDGMQSILMLVCMSKCWLQNWWRQTNKNLIASHHNCYTLAKTKILTVAKQSLHCYIPISNNLHSQLNPDNHIWRTNVKRSKLNSSKARARKSERERKIDRNINDAIAQKFNIKFHLRNVFRRVKKRATIDATMIFTHEMRFH